jgi:hypothetical protein
MSSMHFFYERAVIAFTLAMTVCMMPSHILAADATEIKAIPAGNEKPADSSGAESAHIDIEARLPKQSYKIDEPIILTASIKNLLSYELFYVDSVAPEANFEISIREKKIGEPPLTKFGAALKQPHRRILSRGRVWVKPGDVKSYDLDLRKLFDLGEGSYEVITQRRLFLLDKESFVELRAKPIQFEVTK